MDNKTAHILRAVPHRAISECEDETICLTTLPGLDLANLLNVRVSETDLSNGELADQKMIQTVPFRFFSLWAAGSNSPASDGL